MQTKQNSTVYKDGRTQFTSARHRYEDDDEIEVCGECESIFVCSIKRGEWYVCVLCQVGEF